MSYLQYQKKKNRSHQYRVHPLSDVNEGVDVCDVIHQHDTVGPPEVVDGQRPEPLLSCRVPHLQRHRSVVLHVDCAQPEVHSFNRCLFKLFC